MNVDEIVGRFAAASNATLLGRSRGRLVIYKPVAGNRPLWDFDVDTLAAREVLTYEVAGAMGLRCVPATTMGDGPYGPGAVQDYIDVDEGFDPLDLIRARDPVLWPIAVLDIVVNNADRKLGHVLREAATDHLFAIDHGLTFHAEDKLRTVLWMFAGEAIPTPLMESLAVLRSDLAGGLGSRVRRFLGDAEAAALDQRVEKLIESAVHPEPPDDRPPMPWPPY